LLLATPLAFESAIGVRETAPGAREGMATEVARVEVTILSEDTVRVNRITLPRGRMESILQPLLDQGPRQVVIACGGDISHGTFVDVLDRAKQCGAAGIAVSGR
jgi:biopolymer transport protein ExbD